MLAGHFGVGLGLKARYTSVPLAPILLAAALPDLLFVLLQALGWESLAAPAAQPLHPGTFGSVPFSHDLSMAAIAAGLTASLMLLLVSSRWALALGIAVFSHVLLDVLVQPPVIGVGGPWLPIHVGLDLWRRARFLGWGAEMLVVLGGGWMYLRARQEVGPGRRRAWGAPVLLVAVQLASLVVR